MKVSELRKAELNFWVAKAEGYEVEGWWNEIYIREKFSVSTEVYSPSTNWSQGGPIIEREKISVEYTDEGWESYDPVMRGRTALEAAMRCYVASKFGEDVPNGN